MSGSLDGRFHQAVYLWRREPLIPAVVLGQLEDGEGLAIDHFFRGKALPKWANGGADDQAYGPTSFWTGTVSFVALTL